VPDAVVSHEVPPERSTWSFFLRRCWAEGRGKHALWVLAGPNSRALDEESRFVRAVLTRGLLRNLAAVAAGDRYGLARVSAIVLGTAAACAGFLVESLQQAGRNLRAQRWSRARETPDTVEPIPAPEQEAAGA
jgi:hypothetical protein